METSEHFQDLKRSAQKPERNWSDRTWGNDFRLEEGRVGLHVRKKSFPLGLVRHWHQLPREVVNVPS